MRFYVPEWDDNVDAHYDFEHDEHSELGKDERQLQYIWDIFDYETTPIDGVLISREQVEESATKFDRLTSHGVYDEQSNLNIPNWLPTISDCGAWGYKTLPFPPYDNDEMLAFYENLDVTVGVTIDHLVLGSGHETRLYLDKRAFADAEFTPSELPKELTDEVDVMIDEWPSEWPAYVEDYDSTICDAPSVNQFEPEDFEGDPVAVLERLCTDPRAVYREDDTEFRYQLTLNNAREMKELYDANDYSFRLMVAIQGWDPISYARAAEQVLERGYQYIGIGGVAGSNAARIRDIVTGVGNAVKEHERTRKTRVDTHVFGFAKTDAFDAIGQTGMSSFDSASMLRSAWTGGDNYHLDSERRYDALRVRFGSNRDSLEKRIQIALRGQELLHSLRAFDEGELISKAIRAWVTDAERALDGLAPYLKTHRHDDAYDQRLLRDIEEHFRDDYEYGRELRASFSRPLRNAVIKLLRDDNPKSPLDFDKYQSLIDTAREQFDGTFPRMAETIEQREKYSGDTGTFDQIWLLVEDYASWIGDERLLEEYKRLLREEPWKECDCRICREHGIEVAIFRANNRNRRRGFHNTKRFYDQFREALPKTLVAMPASDSLTSWSSVEGYFLTEQTDFWSDVHDLPVAEVGVISAEGIHEWWSEPPTTVSLDPTEMAASVGEFCARYQKVFLYDPDKTIHPDVVERIEQQGCTIASYQVPSEFRAAVLDQLGYDSEFLPEFMVQKGLMEF
ncbi:queuine tRNA-ribosyltransferase tRNA-guanine transglycosylase [Natronosalvus rutilus]|uniref:Queuine tRNA-ribosyltransferase tRNA-guanine transglycosylase n=1 Tax=Natronosalvus rutilus TaxID=2953753 RepID=A0A9E7NF25_9EURY|nr:queuine tRNA-ribosyltransferase tRNA-guanine transglycosylase [Natronosalvus rutilus]UTF55582.1 queuine tRNA-ribosyltransferase tRNA-guanine transglycosylase [Natronosalvus rutilus]